MSENPVPAVINCFHCGEAVPQGLSLSVNINGNNQPMCCYGCQAVSRTIIDCGLEEFYKYRTNHSLTPDQPVPGITGTFAVFDNPKIQQKFVTQTNEYGRETSLILEGIVCPACVWLNERHISALPGIMDVSVNYTNNRAWIRWDDSRIHLSDILKAISDIGYTAHPYTQEEDQFLFEKERKVQLQRIGLAGLLSMQVMMNSIALYTGEWSGIDLAFKKFFYWFNLILTTPVVLYSAQPFFKGAWRDLQQFRTGMDVPVALGIGIAYLGCVWSTITGTGEVYYDSVVMFVFLLLLGRYFEFMARKKAREHTDVISHILPATITRLLEKENGFEEEIVPVVELEPGDRVLIHAGETIPADGVVIDGISTINESLLTGESLPVIKQAGSKLIAGSTNIESPLQMSVNRIGTDTVLSQILKLIERAQSEKPGFTQLANRISGWFVLSVLIIAGLVAWYWWNTGQDIWLPVTISVLVATCPCALSLATPVALTAATTTYLKMGIAITQHNAVENLARATHYIFDKTGTLTLGKIKLDSIRCLSRFDDQTCLAIAASLERNSEHPVGIAILGATDKTEIPFATDIKNFPGEGITGMINDTRYFIGTVKFITEKTGLTPGDDLLKKLEYENKTTIILADSGQFHCIFSLSDEIRPQAEALIDFIKKSGKKVILLSGDRMASVKNVGDALHIDTIIPDLKPGDKLSFLRNLREQNEIIAMVGDGINDAPVLACADISIAMGGGTDLAKINADMILLNNQLDNLRNAIRVAYKTFSIIRQNIIWAIAYNLLILPSAAMGFITPWMAALGMSLSSLVVVGNASRINK
ncbi:MAG: heavy metal translocating P-type ATPase [Gammaproteobacteria bacterium]|nr:heavy metal translocating P-type ATPase [Gammaproteobacteria bacterium]